MTLESAVAEFSTKAQGLLDQASALTAAVNAKADAIDAAVAESLATANAVTGGYADCYYAYLDPGADDQTAVISTDSAAATAHPYRTLAALFAALEPGRRYEVRCAAGTYALESVLAVPRAVLLTIYGVPGTGNEGQVVIARSAPLDANAYMVLEGHSAVTLGGVTLTYGTGYTGYPLHWRTPIKVVGPRNTIVLGILGQSPVSVVCNADEVNAVANVEGGDVLLIADGVTFNNASGVGREPVIAETTGRATYLVRSATYVGQWSAPGQLTFGGATAVDFN